MESIAPLSAFIICKNEERTIEGCLRSLAGLADIVVVDSGSTDRTLSIVRGLAEEGLPIRLFEREWPGYARQKQFAFDQCLHLWRINLDADERLDEDLRRALAALKLDDSGVAAYKVRHTDWLPGYGWPPKAVHKRKLPRLMHGTRVRYDESTIVHEALFFDGRIESIQRGAILHDRLLSISEEIPKNVNYARLKALSLGPKGREATLFSLFFNPVGRFIKSYLLQRYFLCGLPGFIYAANLAIYVFATEAILYRLTAAPELPEQ